MKGRPMKLFGNLAALTAALALAVAACGGVVEELAEVTTEEPGGSPSGGQSEAGGETSAALGSAIQEPAAFTLAGDMAATFDGDVECRVEGDTLAYDVGRGAFTGRPSFVFTSGGPEEGHQLGLFIVVLGFTGEPGTYDAEFDLEDFPGPYDEPVARSSGTGTVQLDVAERGFDFVNVSGTIDGSYSGELGAGELSGSLGVCGYYTDDEPEEGVAAEGMDAEVGLLEMSFTGDYEGEVIDGFVDSFCYVDDAGALEVVFYLDESWPFSLIMTVPGFDGPGTHSGTWEASGYGEEFELISEGPVTMDVEVLHDDDYDEDWGRFDFSGSFSGDMGSAEAEGNFACSFG